MSIMDTVARLRAAKNALIAALTAKGVEVPDDAGFEDFPALTELIEAGDGDGTLKALIEGTLAEIVNDEATAVKERLFYRSVALKKVNLPNVARIASDSFGGCSSLTEVHLPNLKTVTGSFHFNQCASLAKVDFPLLEGGDANTMFGYCTALGQVNLPLISKLGAQMFVGCTSLSEVYFPNVTTVYSSSFENCSILGKVIFDKTVGFIRQTIFKNCTALYALVLRGDELSTLSYTNIFTGTPIESGTGYIYVPKALLSDDDNTKDYRQATNWSVFAEQFRAIEDYPDIVGGVAE